MSLNQSAPKKLTKAVTDIKGPFKNTQRGQDVKVKTFGPFGKGTGSSNLEGQLPPTLSDAQPEHQRLATQGLE